MAKALNRQQSKALEVAGMMKTGPLAVIHKILVFQKYLEDNDVKIDQFFKKIEEKVEEQRGLVDDELSKVATKIEEKVEEQRGLVNEELSKVAPELKEEFEKLKKIVSPGIKGEFEELKNKVSECLKIINDKSELSDIEISVEKLRKDVSDFLVRLEEVRSEIPEPPEAVDLSGVHKDLAELRERLEKILPEVTGEQIISKINELPVDSDNQIDKTHIKGWDDLEKGLAEAKNRPVGGGGVRMLQYLADTKIDSPTNNQVLKYNATTKQWVNGSGGGSGTITGTDTHVVFFDGDDSPAGEAGLTWNKTSDTLTVGATTGNIVVRSADTANGTGRITLSTYERAVSPTHYSELIRLDAMDDDAKAAIAFRDSTGETQAWVQYHDFSEVVDPAKKKDFVDADVNTTTDVITITAHGFTTADAAWFYSTGTLPTGIIRNKRYYIGAIDADTVALYRSAANASSDTGRINITSAAGTGTHTMDSNNRHQHLSFETKNGTSDTVDTRMEVTTGADQGAVRVVSADFVMLDANKIYLTGENGSNKEIVLGIDESDVYKRFAIRLDNATESGSNVGSDFRIVRYSDSGAVIDSPLTITRSNGLATFGANIESNGTTIDLDSSATATVAIDRGATTNFASNVFRTAGTDQWTVGLRNDSTNNLYVRDNINGVNVIQAALGATPAVTAGGAWTFSNSVALGANSLTMTGSLAATGNRVTKGWFTDIESTNMPTVGGTAVLTSLTAPQFTTVELGHATDTTLSRSSAGVLAVEGVVVPTVSSTDTLTNKRITSRVVSTADDATAVIDVDVTDQYQLTAMANATTISTTGTPTEGQKLTIRLKDNGTARALTWDSVFRAIGVTIPTTTIISKTVYIGCIYNSTDSKWDAVAVSQEA